MHRCFLTVLIFFFFIPSLSYGQHPFTFEDMMALKRVEEPEPSPDGKWVLFAAVDVDLDANARIPHVWIVPLAGGKEREIITDQDADRPRWAPNGKRFAFVSTKEGGSQIWVADFDGATGTVTGTHKLTSIATEASGELWSPDGKNILFKSDVYPECDGTPTEESDCNAKKLEEVKNSKIKAQIFTHLLYRHWNAYKEGKRSHLFVTPVPLGDLIESTDSSPVVEKVEDRDLTPGDFDAPPFSLGGQDNYAFSPDGQEICYTSNHDPEPAISTNNDLWIVPVNGGTGVSPVIAKNITAENKASDSIPLYSPDGKYIGYRAQQRPGYESDRFRLMLYDRKTVVKKDLTENFDRWVGSFTWTPDSKEIYFTAQNKGSNPLFRIDIQTAAISTLSPCAGPYGAGSFDDLQFSPDGKTLLTSGAGVTTPAEIFAFDTKAFEVGGVTSVCVESNANPRVVKTPSDVEIEFERTHGLAKNINPVEVGWKQITSLNYRVRLPFNEFLVLSPDDFWFRGANGDPVQGFIIRPPEFALDPNKKYPVKFIIHGGPEVPMGDEWSYRWNAELFAANGYVVIFINFHGSPGYGQKFIDSINGDWGGAPFEDLMKGLDYAEAHYPFIDKDRECALGASYGGYMTNWILGHTNRFKCIVTHDGMFNTESAWGTTEELWFSEWEFKGTPYTNRELYRKWSPHLFAANFKTPTLVVHGQLDYRLDASQGFDLFTTLQRMVVPSKMLYFPDEGHWILKPQNSQLWYKTVNDWVDQWVGK